VRHHVVKVGGGRVIWGRELIHGHPAPADSV
jgi:hypothetical protein